MSGGPFSKTTREPRRPNPFFLILASASPRRRELLRALGLRLKAVSAQVEEKRRKGEDPFAFAHRMAREKAACVSHRYPQQWVLGADTVVVLEKVLLGKPKDRQQALRFLSRLSGKEHRVITAFCLTHGDRGLTICRSVTTRVTFKRLSQEEIQWYVQTGEPLDKAGAYAIQGRGAFMVRRIRGSYTNVVGLPVTEVLEVLERFAGFQLGDSKGEGNPKESLALGTGFESVPEPALKNRTASSRMAAVGWGRDFD